jgi:polar amino acid transport system substrate-binding protein
MSQLHRFGWGVCRSLFMASIILGHSAVTHSAEPTAPSRELAFITIDVAPWAYNDPDTGENEGAFVEIIKEVERRIQQPINVTITPFARVDRQLDSGEHDCTILVPLSEKQIIQGDIVSYHPIGFIARKGVVINQYDDIKNLRISVIRGAAISPEFDSDQTLIKEFDTDYVMGLRKVARGRLDVIVGAIPTLQYLIEEESLQQQFEEPFAVTEIPLVFQCSRKSPNLDQMDRINAVLLEIKSDGTLEQIRSRYYF